MQLQRLARPRWVSAFVWSSLSLLSSNSSMIVSVYWKYITCVLTSQPEVCLRLRKKTSDWRLLTSVEAVKTAGILGVGLNVCFTL